MTTQQEQQRQRPGNGEYFNARHGVTDESFCRACDLYRPCLHDGQTAAALRNVGVVGPPDKPVWARHGIDGDNSHRGRRALTLIELLVIVAIVSVLAAILLPVFAAAREKSRQAAAAVNTRTWSRPAAVARALAVR